MDTNIPETVLKILRGHIPNVRIQVVGSSYSDCFLWSDGIDTKEPIIRFEVIVYFTEYGTFRGSGTGIRAALTKALQEASAFVKSIDLVPEHKIGKQLDSAIGWLDTDALWE